MLEIQNLVSRFYTPDGVVHAVNGVSFHVDKGKTLGIVGESGCGKSVTMMSILRLIPEPPGKVVSGKALFQGQDLLKLPKEGLRKIRGGRIAMIFQDPMTSLNPSLTVGKQVSEALAEHCKLTNIQARRQSIDLLKMVGIPNPTQRIDDYPHQFSGGMRQRVMIAMSLSCQPEILIADEPTTALDVTIQAQIIELVKKLREELGMAVIWITHDLGVVACLADSVAVMYSGFIVEQAAVRELYKNPRHPYTIGLLGAIPRIDGLHDNRLTNIKGQPPNLLDEPNYCPFAPRCSFAIDKCWDKNPKLGFVKDDHEVACWVDTSTVTVLSEDSPRFPQD